MRAKRIPVSAPTSSSHCSSDLLTPPLVFRYSRDTVVILDREISSSLARNGTRHELGFAVSMCIDHRLMSQSEGSGRVRCRRET